MEATKRNPNFKRPKGDGTRNLFQPGNKYGSWDRELAGIIKQDRKKADGDLNRRYAGKKRGEDLPQSKVTAEDVRMMRQIHEEGKAAMERWRQVYTAAAIAEKFGISESNVEKILRRVSWAHV